MASDGKQREERREHAAVDNEQGPAGGLQHLAGEIPREAQPREQRERHGESPGEFPAPPPWNQQRLLHHLVEGQRAQAAADCCSPRSASMRLPSVRRKCASGASATMPFILKSGSASSISCWPSMMNLSSRKPSIMLLLSDCAMVGSCRS